MKSAQNLPTAYMRKVTRESIYINVQGGRSFTDTSTSVWPPTPANTNPHATNQSNSRQRHTTVSEGKIDSTTFLLIIERNLKLQNGDNVRMRRQQRSSRAEPINVGAGLVWIYITHCAPSLQLISILHCNALYCV